MFGLWEKKRLKVSCLSASETGLVRKDNQDSLFVDGAKSVFCVADGMGGGSEGATAAVLLLDPSDSRRTAICHVGDSRIYRIRRRKERLARGAEHANRVAT